MDSCKTCKWWYGFSEKEREFKKGYGVCGKLDNAGWPIAYVVGSHLETKPDFYCNQWESKDEIK